MAEDVTMEGMLMPKRQVLESGLAVMFMLWEIQLKWHNPMVKEGMMTQPGVHMEDGHNGGLVMEDCLRWALHKSLAYTYRGDHFKEGKELEPYLNDPKGKVKKTLPCQLVIWDQPDRKFSHITGEAVFVYIGVIVN